MIKHSILKKGVKSKEKNKDITGFLLSNQNMFFSLSFDGNFTNYNGLFSFYDNTPYKTIENIYLNKTEETEKTIINKINSVERATGKTKEIFSLENNCLKYEINDYDGWIKLELDFRKIFSKPRFGRTYTVYEDKIKNKKHLLVEYTNEENKEKHFMVLYGVKEYKLTNNWNRKEYIYDKKRGNNSEFYVYQALEIKCNGKIKIIIGQGRTKEEAISNINEKNSQGFLKKIPEKDMDFAYINALNSLSSLMKDGRNIRAGLPWFFQIWSRDEIISLNAFIQEGKYEISKKILWKYLGKINENGRIPNILDNDESTNADSTGWLFLRVRDFIKKFGKKTDKKDRDYITEKLKYAIKKTEENYMEDNMIHNYAQETWMDTISREGFCIENQAFYLNMLNLMQKLEKNQNWKKKEKEFRKNIKENFFDGKILKDNLKDNEIRPNAFISYYVYPELLTKKEWETVFDNLIERLWLGWGGISTADKKSNEFHEYYTGGNDFSYHQGDSWFWLNNLTALCMIKLNKKKYKKYIEKIKEASTEDILFRGFIGHASELSDAKELNPGGTFCQAWSSAMFIELMNNPV